MGNIPSLTPKEIRDESESDRILLRKMIAAKKKGVINKQEKENFIKSLKQIAGL